MIDPSIVLLISADAEWLVTRNWYNHAPLQRTPFGETLRINLCGAQVCCVHGGWGKVAAAASTQYAIQVLQPALLVNLGTCGGLQGFVERGDIILVEETLIYDIVESMGDPQAAIDHYATHLDLSWLSPPPYPLHVRRGRLVSADHDIQPAEIATLRRSYSAIAADWESGAIAWVAQRNQTPCLILRGVSDLVGEDGGEAYQDPVVFQAGVQQVMQTLLASLPNWLACTNIGFMECSA